MCPKIKLFLRSSVLLMLSAFSASLLGMEIRILNYVPSRDYEAIRTIAQSDKVGGIAPAFQCLSDNTIVARVGNQTVGFIDYTFNSSVYAPQPLGYVKFMGVAECLRGRGIGGKLLTRALNEIEKSGCPRTELCVFESNQSAIRLYEKIGFSCVCDCGGGLLKMVRMNQKSRSKGRGGKKHSCEMC